MIRGHVLEVKDNTYTRFFGGSAVSQSTVLDIDPDNRQATLIADLSAPKGLPRDEFDALILTQVLQYLPDLPQSVANIEQSMKPGGAAIITVPVTSRIDPASPDLWRFTPRGLAHLLRSNTRESNVTVTSYGSLLTQTAYLHGLAAQELTFDELMKRDPDYPVTAAALVVRRASSAAT